MPIKQTVNPKSVTLKADKYPEYYSATINVRGINFKSDFIKKLEGWSHTLDISVKELEKRIIIH
jgi:hypothetical protein